MILTARLLSTKQRCARQFALQREYRYPKYHPKTLYEHCLRNAVLALSNGTDQTAEDIAKQCTTDYMEKAANPGIDTAQNDPYLLARDWCAVLETTIEALSRLVLLSVQPGPTLTLSDHTWVCSAFRDQSGVLHRWIAVDHWDDDAKFAELHSWNVFGDCAAAKIGMALHVIEIGRSRNSHQQTPWCRAFKHPVIHGRYAFCQKDGSRLANGWKPLWYQDSDKNKASTWVDMMERDGINLIHHIDIREPKPEHIAQFRREIEIESAAMEQVGPWQTVPMSRDRCDKPYPCWFQNICYGPPGLIHIEKLGYQKT